MSAGRELPPSSPYAGDDGSAEPGLAAAIARYADGAGSVADVVEVLATARVLVPVMAELAVAGHGHGGLEVDKEAHAGVVAVRTPDGRTALPVFSSMTTLRSWHPQARPVPAEGRRAAAAALQEGWEVVVLDPGDGGPTVLVPGPAVRSLAAGRSWLPAVAGDTVRDEVARAVAAAATRVTGVRSAQVHPGRRAELAVVLGLAPGLGRSGLDAVLAQVNDRLAADPVVLEQVDSLELRVVRA